MRSIKMLIIIITFFNIYFITSSEYNLKFLDYELKQTGNYTKDVLDTFAKLQGEKSFPQDVWDELFICLTSPETPNLLKASNNGWKGLLQHGQENRTNDPWSHHTPQYRENNGTILPKLENIDKVIIFSPCATVSNIAYYRTYLTICGHERYSKFSFNSTIVSAFKKGFVFETFSSAFWHASGTFLGRYCDNRVEDLWTLIIHQASISSLPPDSDLLNLDESSSDILAYEIMNVYENMFLNDKVFEWEETLKKYQYTSIYKSMAALISTGFVLTLPLEEAKWVVSEIGKILIPNDYYFITEKYIPKLKSALELKNVNPSIFERTNLIKKIIGVVVKLFYGVIFQEELIKSDILLSEKSTYLGTILMPIFNRFSNLFTGYDHYSYIFDKLQQQSKNIYPGRKICGGKKFSHNLWHEQTANALVDLFYLADDINRLISGEIKN